MNITLIQTQSKNKTLKIHYDGRLYLIDSQNLVKILVSN